MKKITLSLLSFIIIGFFTFGAIPVFAAKPQKAIEIGNGMPSGYHEILLLHGKKDGYQCVECDPTIEQCNVINIPEIGTATIQYVSGKKVQIEELTVFDSCAGWEGNDPTEDDPAEVWLPYEQEGYYVFARTLGKPGKDEEERYIILENESLEAYQLLNDVVSNPDDVLLGLGMITQQGVFKLNASGELCRFDGDSVKGKGKSQGINIRDMFLWSGLVFDPALDVTGDGVVNELDVIADTCTGDTNQDGIIDNYEFTAWVNSYYPSPPPDVNGDGVVDAKDVIADTCPYDEDQDGEIFYDDVYNPDTFPDCEFENWLADNTVNTEGDPLWQYYDEEWVFTIADLVYMNQVVTNQGIKNLQIWFFPKDTTVFTPVEQ